MPNKIFALIRNADLGTASSRCGLLRYLLETTAGCGRPAWIIGQRQLAERLGIPIGTLRRVIELGQHLGCLEVTASVTTHGRGWCQYEVSEAGLMARQKQGATKPAEDQDTRTTRNTSAHSEQHPIAPCAIPPRTVSERVFHKVPEDTTQGADIDRSSFEHVKAVITKAEALLRRLSDKSDGVKNQWCVVQAELSKRGILAAVPICRQIQAAGGKPPEALAVIAEYDRRSDQAATWPATAPAILANRIRAAGLAPDQGWPEGPAKYKPPKPTAEAAAERRRYMAIRSRMAGGASPAAAVAAVERGK